jgi:hypothetical protein
MDWHSLWVVLLVLPFPIWPWVFRLLFHRLRTTRQFMLAGLVSAALAVGFSVAFWRGLDEPQLARVAALIYGGPAGFFILIATFGWFAQHLSVSPSTLDDRTSRQE